MNPGLSTYALAIGALLTTVIYSCQKDNNVSNSSTRLSVENYTYIGDSDKANLGRVLFYDKAMSVNNSVSCGTCHKQSLAFADNTRLSGGFDGRFGNRNTPPIQNLSTIGSVTNGFVSPQTLFWDGRESDLKTMVLKPVFNHVEMGILSDEELIKSLKSKTYYKDLFLKAFKSEEITKKKISESLSLFVANLQSNNSRFDLFTRSAGRTSDLLSTDELAGKDLFFGKYNCGSCHNVNIPKGYSGGGMDEVSGAMANIGLSVNYEDNGRGDLLSRASENGKFKIPNLRNVALTAPYMHDGRFNTLEEVIDHYSTNIQSHPNLDRRLKDVNGQPKVFNVTDEDKRLLIAFLNSMTDHSFISDPKFSDPFIKQ